MRVPKDAPSAWKKKDGKGFYTIGSLWMCVQMRQQKQMEYNREANKSGVPLVVYMDMKNVNGYFTGQVNESASIDAAERAKTMVRLGGDRAADEDAAAAGSSLRKREAKAEQKHAEMATKALKDGARELTVADYLAMNEKPTTGRAAVVRCRKKNFLKVLQIGYQLVQRFDDADKM